MAGSIPYTLNQGSKVILSELRIIRAINQARKMAVDRRPTNLYFSGGDEEGDRCPGHFLVKVEVFN